MFYGQLIISSLKTVGHNFFFLMYQFSVLWLFTMDGPHSEYVLFELAYSHTLQLSGAQHHRQPPTIRQDNAEFTIFLV